MALSAIYRTGERFGAAHLVDVLTGKTTEKVSRMKHDGLKVFGVGKDIPAKTWQSVFRQLTAGGFVRVDHGAYGALKLDGDFRAVFKDERQVMFRKDRPAKGRSKTAKLASAASDLSGDDVQLFEVLRSERTEIARGLGIPAYMVFSDATLSAMAAERPGDLDAFMELPGVGQAKLDKYGERFLEVIAHVAASVP